MDWLGELLFAISFATWVALAASYSSMRLVRDSFADDEVGRQLADFLTTLFGFVIVLATLSLARLAFTVNVVEDPVTTAFRIVGAMVYGAIVIWAIRAVRSFRAIATPAAPAEYDPYAEPFGEV